MRRTFALLLAGTALALLAGSASASKPRLSVYFLRGEQVAPVPRSGATVRDAVRALLGGPTRAETARGFRTYVPRGIRIRSATVAGGIATVDLNERFAGGRDTGSLLARLAELVRTLTGVQGTKKVQLLLDGSPAVARFPGVNTGKPISFRDLQKPNVPVPEPPPFRLPPPDPEVKALQQKLIQLGYMIHGDDDGRFGPATQNAILGFQKWERLPRTGLMDAKTNTRLDTATRPVPITRGGAGKRAEILLDRQVALLIRDDVVIRAISVSSGKPSTPTPPGSFRVYAKIQRWWSTPFREWLPWAIPFVGGIAFHQYPIVPAFPASHGCVRQLYSVARWTYNFAFVGMPVKVLSRS
jgi:peptidoglycan hydrolase-like protein with peptidoglycan-binding domain